MVGLAAFLCSPRLVLQVNVEAALYYLVVPLLVILSVGGLTVIVVVRLLLR